MELHCCSKILSVVCICVLCYSELDSGRSRQILAPETFVSGYATAEMTLHYVPLVRQLWTLVEKMFRRACEKCSICNTRRTFFNERQQIRPNRLPSLCRRQVAWWKIIRPLMPFAALWHSSRPQENNSATTSHMLKNDQRTYLAHCHKINYRTTVATNLLLK